MSKRIFDPALVPVQQQSVDSPDFNSDMIMSANPYVMRGRMATGNKSRRGTWSVVNLIDFKTDSPTGYQWASEPDISKLYKQTSYLNVSKWSNKFFDESQYAYVPHVDTVTITLDDSDVINAPITGVDVWFRWMPMEAFDGYSFDGSDKINGVLTTTWNCTRETPCGSWQDEAWSPTEWQYAGSHTTSSFTVTVPMPVAFKELEQAWAAESPKPTGTAITTWINDWFFNNKKDLWFQILVTGHSTWKPNPYNYRWIGITDKLVQADFANSGLWSTYRRYWTADNPSGDGALGQYKVGESFISHKDNGAVQFYNAVGYLPWNPYYGKTINNEWNTYHRQRTTFGDIALFAPKRWRKTYV